MPKNYTGILICERCDQAMLFFRQFVVRNNRLYYGVISAVQSVEEKGLSIEE